MEYWKVILAALVLSGLSFAEPLITCTPQKLRGLPGEPLRLEITIETDRAAPIQLKIPHIDILYLSTIEKIPIQRIAPGRYLQKRTIIWQGLESGQTTITNLTVLFQGLEKSTAGVSPAFQTLGKICPNIGIIIEEVEAAEPPEAIKEEE